MDDLISFITLSRHAGMRFDWVQAAGGNTSVKLADGTMLVKASGFLLSEMGQKKGYCKVNLDLVKNILQPQILNIADKKLRDQTVTNLMQDATIDASNRPSIETLLHAIVPGKYVLHTHPITVNCMMASHDWQRLMPLFPEAIFIAYHAPGIELASAIELAQSHFFVKHQYFPKEIFLENHGLIVSGKSSDDILQKMAAIENLLETLLNLQLAQYRYPVEVAALFNQLGAQEPIVYLSDDKHIAEYLISIPQAVFSLPFCPDKAVYCGVKAVRLHSLTDAAPLLDYFQRYQEWPKVIIYEDNILFVASSLKKAREIEEVFKFHLMVLRFIPQEAHFLSETELTYLLNWDAEKYRQHLDF